MSVPVVFHTSWLHEVCPHLREGKINPFFFLHVVGGRISLDAKIKWFGAAGETLVRT